MSFSGTELIAIEVLSLRRDAALGQEHEPVENVGPQRQGDVSPSVLAELLREEIMQAVSDRFFSRHDVCSVSGEGFGSEKRLFSVPGCCQPAWSAGALSSGLTTRGLRPAKNIRV
jgi:hypothetical protein